MARIAIVSNRLPALAGKDQAAGGLAFALRAALDKSGGTWFGWDARSSGGQNGKIVVHQSSPFTLAGLPLTEREYAGYYRGFANRVLWPLLHGRTDLVRFDRSDYATYRAVNEKFARSIAPLVQDHDLIWVHDFHLAFLAQAFRQDGINLPIGFFLHVPFPAPDVLATLPCHFDLVRALCAYDLVGFQTENDLRNFHEYVRRHLDGAVCGDGTVFALGRKFKTGAFPIGIDTRNFQELAASKKAAKLRQHLESCFHNQFGIVGVDRLDYTKGLKYRFRAFERLLESLPDYRRRVFLLQVAAPSREDVPEYAELRAQLDTLVGEINARHGGPDWTPVRYINRSMSQVRLTALYRLGRVGLVTPLRDGMNLVAKEYVAAQDPDDPGVLVLSQFAGAAERLEGALLVNPYDVDEVVEALHRALQMPLEERLARWTEMMAELRAHDIHDWRRRFISALTATTLDIGAPRVKVKAAGDHPSVEERLERVK